MPPGAARPGFVIEEVKLTSPRLPSGAPPLRLAHLSDFHLRRLDGRHDRLAAVLRQRRPDLILLSGDYVSRVPTAWTLLGGLLARFESAHGTYACRGNWEIKRDAPRASVLKDEFRAAGAELLINESRTVETASGPIRIAAVDSLLRGWPDFGAALADGGDALYTILLAHAPLAARLLPPAASVDLVLSGHTHGGQFRLPGLWPLLLPGCSGGFSDGLYEVDGRFLHVNRGFGAVGIVPARFRCPAEVAFLEIAPG